jgi:hypothetical protein
MVILIGGAGGDDELVLSWEWTNMLSRRHESSVSYGHAKLLCLDELS